ncbi:MAG: DAK2 domain-containing protein [Nocardioidaceae bacterium]|nr:DAK2 domain-containing protein [Nocardioidaceae bacterium]
MATVWPEGDEVVQPLTVLALHAWSDACVTALGAAREEIDALNVYPVPDGDTGTNLYLTFEAAAAAARAADGDLQQVAAAFIDGAVRGARGNSGVIMSALLRASIARIASQASPEGVLDSATLAQAMDEAAAAAYVAVGSPVEGTILSVARAAADAAIAAASAPGGPAQVVSAAAHAARSALTRTPYQLEALRRAGVVDAGGRGLCVVLDATVRVLTGRWQGDGRDMAFGTHTIPLPFVADSADAGSSYEVMFLLDAEDDRVPALRERLADVGDSVVVVGGDGLWNVHVHVDDVGAAIEAGLSAGRPHRIAVTDVAAESRRAATARIQSGRGVVVMAAGVGLRKIFGGAGATVVSGGVGIRCSTRSFTDAIAATGGDEVIVLPNSTDSIAVAEAAARLARERGVRVAVIPTRAQVQGLSAMAVHEPGRSFDDDVVAMTTAAGSARDGAVTVASRRAMTMAGPCEPGDVLGVLQGDFAIIGQHLVEVAGQITQRLLDGGGELLTLVTGEGGHDDLAAGVAQLIHDRRPEIDVVVYDGGQQRYPLLVAVE